MDLNKELTNVVMVNSLRVGYRNLHAPAVTMNIKKFVRRILYNDDVTSLPSAVTTVVFLTQLLGSMTLTMVFSFLPRLVKFFGVSEVKTGYYAGLIGSALFAGRFLSSMFWGYLCDKKGTKFATILSCFTLIFATVAFGFSTTITWALITRFLQGLFMGINISLKAIMGDISDGTNQGLAMSLVLCAYSTGLILGPATGAFLVFPAEHYPSSFAADSTFGKFPILLANVVVAVIFTVVSIIACFVLPSTKRSQDNERTKLIQSSKTKTEKLTDPDDMFCVFSIKNTEPSSFPSLANYLVYLESVKVNGDPCCNGRSCIAPLTIENVKQSKVGTILRKKDCIFACLLYGTYAMVAIGYDELFPVFAATSKVYGGFDFTTKDIGVTLLIVSLVSVLVEIPLCAKLISKYGAKKLFIGCNLLQSVLYPLHVTLASIENKYVFWALLISTLTITRIAIEGSLVACSVFLINSVTPNMYGTINGLGMTVSTLGRTIAPFLFGSIYSWSLTNVKDIAQNTGAMGFPFNQYLAFYLMTIFGIINSFIVTYLSADIERKANFDSA